jgi:hypothetical protein
MVNVEAVDDFDDGQPAQQRRLIKTEVQRNGLSAANRATKRQCNTTQREERLWAMAARLFSLAWYAAHRCGRMAHRRYHGDPKAGKSREQAYSLAAKNTRSRG